MILFHKEGQRHNKAIDDREQENHRIIELHLLFLVYREL